MKSFPLFLFVALMLSACQSHPQDHAKRSSAQAYLLHPSTQNVPQESDPLSLQRLQLQHQERLAKIEAEKSKAIEEAKAQQALSSLEQSQRAKEIEAQSKLRLQEEKLKYEALLAKKEKEIKEMELNASLHRDQIQKEIAALQAQSGIAITKLKGRYESAIAQIQAQLAQKRTWIFLGAFLLLLLILGFFYHLRKKAQAARDQAKYRHERELLERRMHHQHIEKILEIIASKESDNALKIELARLLQQGVNSPKELPSPEKFSSQEKHEAT